MLNINIGNIVWFKTTFNYGKNDYTNKRPYLIIGEKEDSIFLLVITKTDKKPYQHMKKIESIRCLSEPISKVNCKKVFYLSKNNISQSKTFSSCSIKCRPCCCYYFEKKKLFLLLIIIKIVNILK
ncbi:hypothetical protein [Spiroplasma phoeniceum]|uniref:Uncharacterized protein n=1 Tax=Spiroplasma phoeniceum P40 TaxID=1276259 RepID=A0A345DNW1_9MOLU|nr:hypothetical protein [Spiroplasma phoeniceum]AXF95899.1 hypothetical protein SDAV_00918 [Spiroplasma phoeniceum P40]